MYVCMYTHDRRNTATALCVLLFVTCASAHDHRKLHAAYWIKAASKLSSATTDDTPACSADYGEGYLQRWHSLQGSFCSAAANSSHAAYSSVTCHAHPEADLSVCAASNLVMNSKAFMGPKVAGHALPSPRAGSIQLSCKQTTDSRQFLRGRLASNEGSRAALLTAPALDADAAKQQAACSDAGHVVHHAVLLLMRVDGENAFHNLEMLVSLFAALHVLQLPQETFRNGLQVVVADYHPPGLFLDVLRRLSFPHPLRILHEQPFPDGTCFKHLLLAPHVAHMQSLLTFKGGAASDVLCESVILQATSLWLRHLFRDLLPMRAPWMLAASSDWPEEAKAAPPADDDGAAGGLNDSGEASRSSNGGNGHAEGLHWRRRFRPRLRPAGAAAAAGPAGAALAPLQPTRPQSPSQLQHLSVVWLSRSRFERQHEGELTAWQRARQLSAQQQEQLLVELQRAVLQWNEQTCVSGQTRACSSRSVMFSLQAAELSELSFYPDQISLLMRTGVLMGVHGAGLANQVFMPPGRGLAVIELWLRMDENYHYHNMAHMLGHSYFNVRSEEDLDVQAVVKQLRDAMDAVALAHAATRKSWWRRGWG